YVVLIGMMLMYLHIDGRPSKYLFNMLQIVSQGGASLEEILPILRERERQCEVARRSAALRRAKKKAEGR
ncbi:IS4 family transposase, partial [bacterium]|nr:IS4 family transposase [bacterium]